jgi:hypothetical protein
MEEEGKNERCAEAKQKDKTLAKWKKKKKGPIFTPQCDRVFFP